MADPRLVTGAAVAKILSERRARDPMLLFEPLKPQEKFLRATETEVWYIGANRSGKSDALALSGSSLARTGNLDPKPAYSSGGRIEVYDKAVSIWAVSLTFQMSRDILQPKMFNNGFVPGGQPHEPFIPEWESAHWGNNTQTLRLKNGSIIGYKAVAEGRDRFFGAGKDAVLFDEPPPMSVYDECTIRVEAGRKLWIRGAATLLPPEGMVGGISWLYPKKIQPYVEGRTNDLLLVGASIWDNIHLLPEEVRRLEEKYPPGTIDYRIRLAGEWLPGLSGTLAYPNFNRMVHVKPSLVWPECVDRKRALYFSLDFNVEPMGAVVLQRYDRLWRQVDEITLERGSDEKMAEEFCRRYPTHEAWCYVHGDATGGRANTQTGDSDYKIILAVLQKRLKYPVELCVPEKKLNPPVIDRLNAVNLILKGSDGEVRYEMGSYCTETIDDFEQVLRDPKGGIKKTSDKRDPYIRRTAWSDALGYALVWHEPVASQVVHGERRMKTIPSPGYRFGQTPSSIPIVGRRIGG